MAGIGIPLWSSHYPTTTPGEAHHQYAAVTDEDWAGYGGGQIALLQFSDSATGVAGHTVDCSAFRGRRDQLAALFGGTTTSPAPAAIPAAPTGAASRSRNREDHMFITTPTPTSGASKASWPTRRVSFGFDPINGWGGRCVIKLHWSEPGGFVHQAIWWTRRPAGGVGVPNAPHAPVGISLGGQAERFVGLGWELAPPEYADELDLVISAPGGVHLFPAYQR
jgi:hypothetical protein